MTRIRGAGPGAAGTALMAGLALVAGSLLTSCTSRPESVVAPPPEVSAEPAGGFQLVAFDSCETALAGLRSAATAYVGPWGLPGGNAYPAASDTTSRGAAEGDVRSGARAQQAAPPQAGPGYSGTNSHEVGVDEPDLVKTDGRRIVMVSRGVLRVIDPASRRMTGSLELDPGADVRSGWAEANLLLHGDRALILVQEHWSGSPGVVDREGGRPGPTDQDTISGPRLILVDLTGPPTLLGEYRVDGSLVDARQVGGTARVVVRSFPRLEFPDRPRASESERTAANRRIIAKAPIDAWLPRYQSTAEGRTTTGRVGCDRLSRPASYSGTSVLTVLSFDLGATGLGDGEPVSVVADGDTVYSNGPRLYIATDQRWRAMPRPGAREVAPEPKDQATEIFQFDTSGPGRPRYLTATSVPGWLINQYAMSEWDGHLRVATTSGATWGANAKSSSAVYVLRADGRTLTETGRITGLGRGERIYSVRFAEGTGYVVTFRQTDPLYTVDLRDAKAPKVRGELKITGYSAYLHPIAAGRLLGIGQEASSEGRTLGTQVSLFDVTDLTKPTRLAQHHVRYGHSEAEFDPHAFLYWPASGSLVVPIGAYTSPGSVGRTGESTNGALVLRVTDGGIVEAGLVSHTEVTAPGTDRIRRSLVIDGVLWTISDGALKATNLSTLSTLGVVRT